VQQWCIRQKFKIFCGIVNPVVDPGAFLQISRDQIGDSFLLDGFLVDVICKIAGQKNRQLGNKKKEEQDFISELHFTPGRP
jgi:hypothetical protein